MNHIFGRLLSSFVYPKTLRHQVRELLLNRQSRPDNNMEGGGTRLTDRLELIETATGKYYLPADAHADVIATAIRNNSIFDEPIYECAKRFITPKSTALDVGSNFGQIALMMSRHVGKEGMVHAFEADPFVFDILSKNADINEAKITPHFGAVHCAGGETLYFPDQDFLRFSTFGSYGIDYVNGKGRPIPTIAVDDFEYEMPVSFMKIDVQGGDLFVMRGARKTIEKYRMPILFEYEYLFEVEQRLCFQEYIDFVKEIEYVFTRVIMGQNYLILPKEAPESIVKKAFYTTSAE